jgi:hypothetical protein
MGQTVSSKARCDEALHTMRSAQRNASRTVLPTQGRRCAGLEAHSTRPSCDVGACK